ncbi:MAG: RagB/SusD family nutrient uptake outer membrane protein [Thalassobius sp.]|nr:RagB/SusD family nutrient uptake outer membrane protein [Thalassovita sp.]
MKRYINKLIIFPLLLSFLACTDLEEEPVGVLAPESFFKTPSDVQAAIYGAYGHMASETVFGRKLSLTLQLRSDMCDIGDRGTPARRQQVNDFDMDSNNGMITEFWPSLYQVVSAANAAVDGVQLIDATDEEKNALEGEARFVRAYAYYHLVRIFGDIPYIDYFVSDPDAVKSIAKTSAAEVYEHIIADTEFAKENLPDTHSGDVRTRPTAGTAATMLASIHLTLGNFQEAADEAVWVINNKDRFGYALEDDFQTLYIAEQADNLKEHIFAVDFLGQQSGSSSANDDIMGPITGIRGADQNGWSVSVPSMAVYNTWDARDYRRKVSLEDTTSVGGVATPYTEYQQVQRPHIAKFARYPGNANADTRYSDHNYVLFRYAEVLLIAAEALNETAGGPTAEALGYINQVRARARNWAGTMTDFPADLADGMSQSDFRTAVLEERRLELAFEFKRWYDIKRRDMLVEVFTGVNSLESHDNVDTSRDYLFPLPQDELERNANLLPQNSGY